MDRSERCDMFQWADNTSSAAIKAYKGGQGVVHEDDRMSSYIRRWNTMSVAELKVVLKRKKLAVSGKKSALLERLKDAFRAQGDQVDQALGLQSYGGAGGGGNNNGNDNGNGNDNDNDQLFFNEEEMSAIENDQGGSSRLTHMQQAERVLKQVFRFDYFRPSQKWAIERLLRRQSTLVVASTGSGKSLIYQIPSFLLPGMTLVISPLLSLIQDQLDSLPAALPGACLTSNMTAEETGHVLRD